MFLVHTSNCYGQNCTRWAIFRLGIDTLIANILVEFFLLALTAAALLSEICRKRCQKTGKVSDANLSHWLRVSFGTRNR